MAIYQRIIKGNSNATTSTAMTSWFTNCINFINESTNLNITFTISSQMSGSTAFIVTVPMTDSYIEKYGIIMSVSTGSSNYFSNIIFNNVAYPLNDFGNCFDHSNYYSANVMIIYNDDIFRVLVDFDGDYHTLLNYNRVTELSSGRQLWGCTGFVPTSPTAFTLEDLSQARNVGSNDATFSDEIRIANATTKSGRYQLNNLYSYFLPAVAELPEFIPFDVSFSDGEAATALILNKCVVKNSSGTPFGDGKYLVFVD